MCVPSCALVAPCVSGGAFGDTERAQKSGPCTETVREAVHPAVVASRGEGRPRWALLLWTLSDGGGDGSGDEQFGPGGAALSPLLGTPPGTVSAPCSPATLAAHDVAGSVAFGGPSAVAPFLPRGRRVLRIERSR